METSSTRATESPRTGHWPDNPVVAEVWRGGRVESQHRGAWALVDTAGNVLEGAGAFEQTAGGLAALSFFNDAVSNFDQGAGEGIGIASSSTVVFDKGLGFSGC